jgi:hypothetical protein
MVLVRYGDNPDAFSVPVHEPFLLCKHVLSNLLNLEGCNLALFSHNNSLMRVMDTCSDPACPVKDGEEHAWLINPDLTYTLRGGLVKTEQQFTPERRKIDNSLLTPPHRVATSTSIDTSLQTLSRQHATSSAYQDRGYFSPGQPRTVRIQYNMVHF